MLRLMRKLVILFLLAASIIPATLQAQPARTFPDIRITISKGQYNSLLQSKGRKMTLKNPVMIVNGDSARVKEIHSRGNNSLTFEHKSLSVDLDRSIEVYAGNEKFKMKKFDLLNLVMDKNLWHNRWAFSCLKELELFPLHQTFCGLYINEQPQGIYLLVDKAHYYTSGSAKSPYMLRRGVNHVIADEYIDTPDKEEAKRYKQQYLSVYEDLGEFHGEDLYTRLDGKINLDHYFKWLGFNYLIMNGDYADELYLYITPGTRQFDVIPWDYDDILRPVPHEGLAVRNAAEGFKNAYLFSSEDPLDRAIASDPVLYRNYLVSFKNLLNRLTPEVLIGYSQSVRAELQELGAGPLGPASLFLGKEPFSMTDAGADIDRSIDFIVKRRNALLKELEK